MKTKTHFQFRVDLWDAVGEDIIEHIGGLDDFEVATAAYRAALMRWPQSRVILRQGGIGASLPASPPITTLPAASTGEAWLTRISPEELAARLSKVGFRKIVHLTPQEANARYFTGRRDGLQAPHVAQLISATT
jgi:hypothetical protein